MKRTAQHIQIARSVHSEKRQRMENIIVSSISLAIGGYERRSRMIGFIAVICICNAIGNLAILGFVMDIYEKEVKNGCTQESSSQE